MRLYLYFIISFAYLITGMVADVFAEEIRLRDENRSQNARSVRLDTLMTINQSGNTEQARPTSRFVTAKKRRSGGLWLAIWHVDSAGNISKLSEFETNGTVKAVDVAAAGHRGFVTVLSNSQGKLQLISWSSNLQGEITRKDTHRTDLAVSNVHIVRRSMEGCAVAMKLADGRLGHFSVGLDSQGNMTVSDPTITGQIAEAALSENAHPGLFFRKSDGYSKLFWIESGRNRRASLELGSTDLISVAGPFSPAIVDQEWFTFAAVDAPVGINYPGTTRLLVDAGYGKLSGISKREEGSFISELKLTRSRDFQGIGGIVRKPSIDLIKEEEWILTAHLGYGPFCGVFNRDRGKPNLKLLLWDTRSDDDAFIKIAEKKYGGDYSDLDITILKPRWQEQGRVSVAIIGMIGVNDQLKLTSWHITR